MPFISLECHRRPYCARPDLEQRLEDVVVVLRTLRSLDVHASTKREMIDRALWLVAELSGDFAPRYRSDGVLVELGVPIQRDHVHPRAQLRAQVLESDRELADIVSDSFCCLVTKQEHARLTEVPNNLEGWDRYSAAGVVVRDMATYRFPGEANSLNGGMAAPDLER
jgi:hypothetical protein